MSSIEKRRIGGTRILRAVLDRQGVAHAVNPTRAVLGLGFGMMPPSVGTE
jgi:hypothetical protein